MYQNVFLFNFSGRGIYLGALNSQEIRVVLFAGKAQDRVSAGEERRKIHNFCHANSSKTQSLKKQYKFLLIVHYKTGNQLQTDSDYSESNYRCKKHKTTKA